MEKSSPSIYRDVHGVAFTQWLVQSAFLVNIALLGDGDGCNLMWKFPQKQIEIFAPVDLLKAKDTLTELVVVPSTLK